MRLAARGLRDLDAGAERISDLAELEQVRRQARWVHVKSFVAALLLAVVLLVV